MTRYDSGALFLASQMPLTGTLRTWNDGRGFGFIAPTQGGADIFIHISAFSKAGSRPTVGETLVYELGRGRNGQPQAVKAYRQTIGKPAGRPRNAKSMSALRRLRLSKIVGTAFVITAAALVFNQYQKITAGDANKKVSQAQGFEKIKTPTMQPPRYRCDGREYCSQMTSCAEATYFLKNCPDTKMDGDNDGVPCEQQWCTGAFAR